MTVLCESCSRPVRMEDCNSKQDPRTPKTFRSTKGASKVRRDQINIELQTLRSLLPISEQEKERLSYLHTMALVCLHLRRAQLFNPGSLDNMLGPVPAAVAAAALGDPELLLSLPGFVLALAANRKLAYVSENVAHFLGLSVVELLAHGDSIFDLLTSTASRSLQEKLCFAQQHPGTEIEFVTEMRTSRAFRAKYGGNRCMAVKGRFLVVDSQSTTAALAMIFVAFCTPVAHRSEDRDLTSQNSTFQSQHTPDMKFAEVTENVIYYLGYQREQLIGRSWYSLIHPEDAVRAAETHRTLMDGAGGCTQQVVVRVLCKDLSWAWVHIVALRKNGKAREPVMCTNHIISEEEALHIQNQEPQHGTVPSVPPSLRNYTGEAEQQTQPREANISPQDSLTPGARTLNYNPGQVLDACGVKMHHVFLQLPDSPPLQTPQKIAGWPDSWSGPDRAERLSSASPCSLYSPESAFSSDSSPSASFSSLCDQRPTTGRSPSLGTNSDSDKLATNMLAEQIHSLAEIFSQCTKQVLHETPTSSLWPGRSVEDAPMWPRQGRGTNGPLDFPEELSMDEEIIAGILNNLLDNGGLNLPTCELESGGNFNMSASECQFPPLQVPLPKATPCLDQYLFLQTLSSSTSSDSQVPDSQRDGRLPTVGSYCDCLTYPDPDSCCNAGFQQSKENVGCTFVS